jgi:hypothetical protein
MNYKTLFLASLYLYRILTLQQTKLSYNEKSVLRQSRVSVFQHHE